MHNFVKTFGWFSFHKTSKRSSGHNIQQPNTVVLKHLSEVNQFNENISFGSEKKDYIGNHK